MSDREEVYCDNCGIILTNFCDRPLHCEPCGVSLCGEDIVCTGEHVHDKHPEVLDFIKCGLWEEEVS